VPIAPDVVLGARVLVPYPELVNLYGCTLGDHTKVGPFVEIQRGVAVGAGALVGAGAVVTRDVPAHAVVVGNPARVVGDRRDRP